MTYSQRISNLIELDKSDSEIREIIFSEYKLEITLEYINSLRNINTRSESKETKNSKIERKENLVKSILSENLDNPLTITDIQTKILKKYKLNIKRKEMTDLLWGNLKSEIVYYKWTYKLKSELNVIGNKVSSITLMEYLKENISIIINELFGKIEFTQLNTLSENHLYKKGNDIHDFNINEKNCYSKLKNIVSDNFLFLKKYYDIIQNITNKITYKRDLIANSEEDINELDLEHFIKMFQLLFEINDEKIRIKNDFLFNQTKDEIEFLYEAYEKYLGILDKTKNLKLNNNNLSTQKNQLFNEKILDEKKLDKKKFDSELLINNSKYKIFKKKELFKPIFYYNFNSSNGDNEIIINLNHELYKPEYEEFIIKIACSMYFTKSSMTSNVIDIYINRLLSNLALIHE